MFPRGYLDAKRKEVPAHHRPIASLVFAAKLRTDPEAAPEVKVAVLRVRGTFSWF